MWLQRSQRLVEARSRYGSRGGLLNGFLFALMLVACSGSDSADSDSASVKSLAKSSGEVVNIVDFLAANEKLYSQFDEELIIRHFFQDQRDGVFLDVGCAYPIKLSTTYYLEKHLGWSGIAIDAFAYYREYWAKERPETTLLTNAVFHTDNRWIKFHVAGEPSVSSLIKEKAERWGGPKAVEIRVPTITLNKALDDHGLDRVDFVSIDIEGAEPAALAGFDIDRFRPRLVCIEAHANEEKILHFFTEHGYQLIEDYLPHDKVNWYFTPSD